MRKLICAIGLLSFVILASEGELTSTFIIVKALALATFLTIVFVSAREPKQIPRRRQ